MWMFVYDGFGAEAAAKAKRVPAVRRAVNFMLSCGWVDMTLWNVANGCLCRDSSINTRLEDVSTDTDGGLTLIPQPGRTRPYTIPTIPRAPHVDCRRTSTWS
jgi:hypothetical protein